MAIGVAARLRLSTSVVARRATYVDARLRRYGTHAKKRVRSHQARLRPSTDVYVRPRRVDQWPNQARRRT